MSAPAPQTAGELVKHARQLERLLARRRRLTKQLAELEHEIRTAKRFINALTRPFEPGTVDHECPKCGRLMSAHTEAEMDTCTAQSVESLP